MTFDEWLNSKADLDEMDCDVLAEAAWNAAIYEAIGAAWNADDGGDESGGAALSRAEENMEKLKVAI